MMTTSYVCIESASYRRKGANRNAAASGRAELERKEHGVRARTKLDGLLPGSYEYGVLVGRNIRKAPRIGIPTI